LNGVLVLRGVYRRGQERTVTLRPGCRSFLEWIRKRIVLSLWSSVSDRNIEPVLKVVLHSASFTRNDITILTQSACSQSAYRDPKNPEKPIFLKNLDVYANIVKLQNNEDVLLVDNSPMKNLLNDSYSAVHPPSWHGEEEDNFLDVNLKPWLEGLFRSNVAVTKYVRCNPLPSGAYPEDKLDRLAFNVLKAAYHD
jgi:hypothetical protein